MQTLKSLYNKRVVSVDQAHVVATVTGAVVTRDCMGLAGYLVECGGQPGFIPAHAPISVGDGFVVLARLADVLVGQPPAERDLIGTPVCTMAGASLPPVTNWRVDTVTTQIVSYILADGSEYGLGAVMAISDELIVVDDGSQTDARERAAAGAAFYQLVVAEGHGLGRSDLLSAPPAENGEPPLGGQAEMPVAPGVSDEGLVAPSSSAAVASSALGDSMASDGSFVPAPGDADDSAVHAPNDVADDPEDVALDDLPASLVGMELVPDVEPSELVALTPTAEQLAEGERELCDYLVGKTLAQAVVSADGHFVAERGAMLTHELVDEAIAHNALFQLVVSVGEAGVNVDEEPEAKGADVELEASAKATDPPAEDSLPPAPPAKATDPPAEEPPARVANPPAEDITGTEE